MGTWELFILAVGLSMDAFAVSVCKGLSVKKLRPKHMLIAGLYFGGFQALMPNMIKESRESADELNDSFGVKAMLPLAVATSIDALAVGVTFAFLQVNIVSAVSFIGVTTFILSAVGIRIGNIFGAKYKSRAELVGGIVLILMGLKILLEHLGVFEWIGTLFA